jgi:hypothetical protein
MRPIAADHTLSPVGPAVSLAYPPADVLLIAVLARLATTPGARRRVPSQGAAQSAGEDAG